MTNTTINYIYDTIADIKKTHKYDYVCIDSLCDYSNEHEYICDVISNIADNEVDIYNYDLCEWFKNNWELVDDAIAEFGKSESIMKDIQMAQYLKNEQEMYNNLEDMIKLVALDYIAKGITEELTEEDINNILDMCETDIDNNNYVSDINELVNNYIEENINA